MSGSRSHSPSTTRAKTVYNDLPEITKSGSKQTTSNQEDILSDQDPDKTITVDNPGPSSGKGDQAQAQGEAVTEGYQNQDSDFTPNRPNNLSFNADFDHPPPQWYVNWAQYNNRQLIPRIVVEDFDEENGTPINRQQIFPEPRRDSRKGPLRASTPHPSSDRTPASLGLSIITDDVQVNRRLTFPTEEQHELTSTEHPRNTAQDPTATLKRKASQLGSDIEDEDLELELDTDSIGEPNYDLLRGAVEELLREDKMAESLDSLASSLNALTIKIDSYDGTTNPETFVANLKRYIKATGKISPTHIRNERDQLVINPDKDVLEKEVLRMHLKGAAKTWFRELDQNKTFEQCLTALNDRFKISDHQKHVMKLNVFQAKQAPTESFENYVNRVIDASSGLQMAERDLVTIVTQGAHDSIRNFLVMSQPENITDLMKLPLAKSGPQGSANQAMEFVGATATTTTAPTDTTEAKVRFSETVTSSKEGRSSDYDEVDRPRSGAESYRRDSPRPERRSEYTVGRSEFTMNRGRSIDSGRPQGRRDYGQPRRQSSSLDSRRDDSSYQRRLCGKCGYTTCPSLTSARDPCPAKDKYCHLCQKPGHFISVCRTRPGNGRDQPRSNRFGSNNRSFEGPRDSRNYQRNRYTQ